MSKNIIIAAVVISSAVCGLQGQDAVAGTCSILPSTLNFGSYLKLGAAVNMPTTISVTCTSGTSYTVLMSSGVSPSGGSANLPNRRMSNGASRLSYNVYRVSPATNIWPTTTCSSPGGFPCSGTGTGSAQILNVYGRVASGQNPTAFGIYTDTVTVTITY